MVDYNPGWPAAYQSEAEQLRSTLADAGVALEHIGSTAVPGLAAKPTLDIMIGVSCLDEAHLPTLTDQLAPFGYKCDPSAIADEPSRWVFRKGPSDQAEMRTHHLHVTAIRGPYWCRILAFRDHLRSHPEDAAAYVALKRSLAQRFPDDRRAYTRGKHQFVVEIEAKALSTFDS